MRKFWPFSFYFLYYAGIATYAPYTVLYLKSLNFTGAQIGMLMGILPLITMVSTPFWTGVADHGSRHRLVMSITMLGGIAVLITLPTLKTYAPILVLAIVMNLFFPAVIPLADSATSSCWQTGRIYMGEFGWEERSVSGSSLPSLGCWSKKMA